MKLIVSPLHGAEQVFDLSQLRKVVLQGAPDAPTGLDVETATAGYVTLLWDGEGGVSWKVYRGGVLIGSVLGILTKYTDSTVAPNTSYSYQITANNAAGESDLTPAISVTTPANTAPSWNDLSINATYGVFFSVDLNSKVDDVDNQNKTFSVISGSVPGCSLNGSVFSGTPSVPGINSITFGVNDGYTTTNGAFAVDVVGSPIPGIPTSFVATATGQTTISLSWAQGTGITAPTSYELDRSLTGTGGWTNRTSALITSFNDTGLTANTRYFYRVRAIASGTPSAGYATDDEVTQASGTRTGVTFTMDFSTFGSNVTNPQQSAFPNSGTDSVNIRHIAQTGESYSSAAAAAGYQALNHLRINNTIPGPNSERNAECTLYYAGVNYTTGGYQPTDKPRVDFNSGQLLARDFEYWAGFAIYLPSDYVEDTKFAQETLFQAHASTDPPATNYFEFYISGATGGNAVWAVRCNDHGNTSASTNDPVPDQAAFVLSSPVNASHKGNWTYHVLNWKININNPAQNFMKWWMTQDPSVGVAAVTKTNTGTRFGNQGDDFIRPSWNYYKPSWKNDGSYSGNKSGTTVVRIAQGRLGSSSSDYSSMHPTRQSEP